MTLANGHHSPSKPSPAFDLEKVRADFPALHQEVHGKPLAYLDNAATTQKPRAVLDALLRYYEKDNANVHRGVHYLSQRATDSFELGRAKVRQFLNAREDAEIIFVRGATEGINLVAHSWGMANLREGNEILITAMEHHSNIVPWQLLCGVTGARLRIVPMNEAGEVDMGAFQRMLSPSVKIASLVQVSNSLGTINPVKRMVDMAHSVGARVLLDGAQAVQHLPVDVQALDADFYVFSGHKIYGPTGIGALYGKRELLDAMYPYQGGGDMIATCSFTESSWNDLPYKFEAGTPDISGAVGLGAALDYVQGIGLEAIAAHEKALLDYGTERLLAIPGLRLIGTAREKASVLAFVVAGVHSTDLGALVDQEGVAVRVGHHCTQPVMEIFKVPGTVRASLAFYNTFEELDRLADAVEKAVGLHKTIVAGPDAAPRANESITEAQDAIVRDFSRYTDWEERYQKIIELGNQVPDLPESDKDAKWIVKGCQSTVYLIPEVRDGKIHYRATSDAMIVRGLVALLMRVYSGRTAREIVETPPDFIHKLGLNENLTQGRANGLRAMIEQIKLYALVLGRSAKESRAQ